jgi:hypothetical protein
MASEVRTYASERVLLIVGGIPLTGLAEDTFVEIAPSADRVTAAVGADGEIARSISSNRMHTVTITLQATSPSNDVLSGFMMMDKVTGGGGVIPVMVSDLSGRTMFAASQAWITATPSVSFGGEAGTREWTLATGEPETFTIGGNL